MSERAHWTTAGGTPGPADREFAALLDRRSVHVEFQPVVDLRSGRTVALEALARGPAGSALAAPLDLFAAARRADKVAELDWVCRAKAYAAFLSADLPPSLSLFINTEPEGFAAACPADLATVVSRAESTLRVFVEVNDEAIASDPAGVLASVDRARENGWGIAIDDVGASRVPVAMLPMLQADVVKLDLRLLDAAGPDDASTAVASALRHVENTGASLLVERIENEEEARWARSLGAVYGQGRHFGMPAAIEHGYSDRAVPVPLVKTVPSDLDLASPFAPFEARHNRRVEPDQLDRLGEVLLRGARIAESWPVLLVGLGQQAVGGRPPAGAVPAVPRRSLLAVAFAAGLLEDPAPGLRGLNVLPQDPMARERFLVVLTDHGSVAMVARPSVKGLFEVAVTQDQGLVTGIAHHLIRRIPRVGESRTVLPPWRPPDKQPDERSPGRDQVRSQSWRHRLGLD